MATKPSDSRMASLDDSSKDVNPEKPNAILPEESDDEDVEDETLGERLFGLTEMFPEPLVNFTAAVGRTTKAGIKGLYNFSRNAIWVVASSSLILFGPQQKQMPNIRQSVKSTFLYGEHLDAARDFDLVVAAVPWAGGSNIHAMLGLYRNPQIVINVLRGHSEAQRQSSGRGGRGGYGGGRKRKRHQHRTNEKPTDEPQVAAEGGAHPPQAEDGQSEEPPVTETPPPTREENAEQDYHYLLLINCVVWAK